MAFNQLVVVAAAAAFLFQSHQWIEEATWGSINHLPSPFAFFFGCVERGFSLRGTVFSCSTLLVHYLNLRTATVPDRVHSVGSGA